MSSIPSVGQAVSGLGNMSCEGYAFVQGAREFLLEGNWCQGPPLGNENEVIFLGERKPQAGGCLQFILILAKGSLSLRWGVCAYMRVPVRMRVPAGGSQQEDICANVYS